MNENGFESIALFLIDDLSAKPSTEQSLARKTSRDINSVHGHAGSFTGGCVVRIGLTAQAMFQHHQKVPQPF